MLDSLAAQYAAVGVRPLDGLTASFDEGLATIQIDTVSCCQKDSASWHLCFHMSLSEYPCCPSYVAAGVLPLDALSQSSCGMGCRSERPSGMLLRRLHDRTSMAPSYLRVGIDEWRIQGRLCCPCDLAGCVHMLEAHAQPCVMDLSNQVWLLSQSSATE